MKYLSEKREIKETKTWLYRWVSINRNTMNKFCREWQTAHIKSFFLLHQSATLQVDQCSSALCETRSCGVCKKKTGLTNKNKECFQQSIW
jgi:hypothetical protein